MIVRSAPAVVMTQALCWAASSASARRPSLLQKRPFVLCLFTLYLWDE